MIAAKRERVAPAIIALDERFTPLMNIADTKAEEACIGAVLQKPELYPTLAEILQPGDFFSLKNGYIWHSFDTLSGAGKGIDILTVTEAMELGKAPIVGEELIRELARMGGCAPDLRNAELYARAVFQAAMRIRILTAADSMHRLASDKTLPSEALIDQCDTLLYSATNRRVEAKTDALSITNAYYEKVERMLESGATSPGIPLGFSELDTLSGGAYPGEVTVLAGGEGMGKTTWALSALRQVVKAGKRGVLFTLEMTQEEILRIYTAMETGIYRSVLKAFNLSAFQWALFVKATGEMSKWKLDVIDDFPTLTPVQLRRKLRYLWQTAPIDFIVIDGLWLMEASEPSGERFRDVAVIMRDLNVIAREFGIPILITHQYSAEIKNVKFPTLYHLSESAGVRRNAQVVWGLQRVSAEDSDAESDNTMLYILKDRNGQTTGQKLPFVYDVNHACYWEGKAHE